MHLHNVKRFNEYTLPSSFEIANNNSCTTNSNLIAINKYFTSTQSINEPTGNSPLRIIGLKQIQIRFPFIPNNFAAGEASYGDDHCAVFCLEMRVVACVVTGGGRSVDGGRLMYGCRWMLDFCLWWEE
jgi:hypothetical protein